MRWFKLKRAGLFIWSLFSVCWWFFTRPKTQGCNAFVINKDRLLLVRKALFKKNEKWSLPGGNGKKGEVPEETAMREVFEETGIKIKPIKILGSYLETKYFRYHTTYVVLAESEENNINIDKTEIEEASFFDLNKLPAEKGFSLLKALEFYDKKL